MNQTKLGSLIEAIINTAIGFAINFTANLLIFPLFGFQLSLGSNFALGCIYTVISVVRSYCIRRWFNARLHRMATAVAARMEKPAA